MEDHGRKGSPESTRKSDSKPDVVINMPVPELHSVGGVLVHMPHVRFLLYVIIICQKTKKKQKMYALPNTLNHIMYNTYVC